MNVSIRYLDISDGTTGVVFLRATVAIVLVLNLFGTSLLKYVNVFDERTPKLELLDVSGQLAEAIKIIYNGGSISNLF